MRDTNTKLAESNVCGLKPSNCASNTAGHREEAEVDEQKEKRKDEAPNERGEQESDYETSERRKVGGNQVLLRNTVERLLGSNFIGCSNKKDEIQCTW